MAATMAMPSGSSPSLAVSERSIFTRFSGKLLR